MRNARKNVKIVTKSHNYLLFIYSVAEIGFHGILVSFVRNDHQS